MKIALKIGFSQKIGLKIILAKFHISCYIGSDTSSYTFLLLPF